MIDGRVVRRLRGHHRFHKLNFGLAGRIWLNWRPGKAFRWKMKTVGWEGRGVVREKLVPSRLYPPLGSVKDQWVGPREQVLNVPIACWCLWAQ
jgi:hypothetical protein